MKRSRKGPRRLVNSHVNPDDPFIQRSCTRKRQYLTKQRASSAAHRAQRKSGLETDRYHCKSCGYFHIYRKKDSGGNYIPVARNLTSEVTQLKAAVQ